MNREEKEEDEGPRLKSRELLGMGALTVEEGRTDTQTRSDVGVGGEVSIS